MSIYGKRVACITGGTGFRFVARALADLHPNPTTVHVIGTADSGRSTRQLRRFFDMPAIGDLRSRCIDIADRRRQGYREITDLLAYRLSKTAENTVLEKELASIFNGEHTLIKAAMLGNKKFASIIIANLRRFDEKRKEVEPALGPFDLREGSIGNFFLAGAYLDYGNISSAIYLYEMLAGVRGRVLPASEYNMHLAAQFEDGQVIVGQHIITNSDIASPIQRLFFFDHENMHAREIHPKITEEVKETIRGADIIVFSMGSFYTSVLSTLHLMGMAQAIRQSRALKVFIPNTIRDAETREMTTSHMVGRLVLTLRQQDAEACGTNTSDYLQVVITAEDNLPTDLGKGRNFVTNDVVGLTDLRIERAPLIAEGSQKGYYEPERLAHILAGL